SPTRADRAADVGEGQSGPGSDLRAPDGFVGLALVLAAACGGQRRAAVPGSEVRCARRGGPSPRRCPDRAVTTEPPARARSTSAAAPTCRGGSPVLGPARM